MSALNDFYSQASLGNISLENSLQLTWNKEINLIANLCNFLGILALLPC